MCSRSHPFLPSVDRIILLFSFSPFFVASRLLLFHSIGMVLSFFSLWSTPNQLFSPFWSLFSPSVFKNCSPLISFEQIVDFLIVVLHFWRWFGRGAPPQNCDVLVIAAHLPPPLPLYLFTCSTPMGEVLLCPCVPTPPAR